MEFKRLSSTEIQRVANIHQMSFPGFFLSRLGSSFLRLFYAALMKDKPSTMIGVYEKKELIGFVCFTQKPTGIYKRILKIELLRFFIWFLINMATRPSMILKIYQAYVYNRGLRVPHTYSVLLMSICILPENKHRGIGAALLDEAENLMRRWNIRGYYLTTDAINNQHVNNFYIRNNFELFDRFIQGSRPMNVYVKAIS